MLGTSVHTNIFNRGDLLVKKEKYFGHVFCYNDYELDINDKIDYSHIMIYMNMPFYFIFLKKSMNMLSLEVIS